MWDEANPAIWGLLGTLVGAAVSVGTTWLTNAHAFKLEAQKTRDLRVEAARAFQRQTLLELADSMNVLDRKALESYRHELSLVRAGHQWGQGEPMPGLADALVEAFRTVTTLAHRVENEPLRLSVVSYIDTLAESVNADTAGVANAIRVVARDQFAAISARIGECLRSYYSEPIDGSRSA